MNPWAQVVGQVVGTLVGGVMTFAGVVLQQWRASGREREARQQEIEARRTQQRSVVSDRARSADPGTEEVSAD
ncbi:MAG: hypothetical protein ACXVA7_12205 [Isosphaeraceae bacterium]